MAEQVTPESLTRQQINEWYDASPRHLSNAIDAAHALGVEPGPCYRVPTQNEVDSARRRICEAINACNAKERP